MNHRAELLLSKARLVESINEFEQQEQRRRLELENDIKTGTRERGFGEFCRKLTECQHLKKTPQNYYMCEKIIKTRINLLCKQSGGPSAKSSEPNQPFSEGRIISNFKYYKVAQNIIPF